LLLVHLDGGYLKAVEMIEGELNVPVQYTTKEYRTSSKEGLKALEKLISDLKITEAPYQDSRLNNLKVLVDYQFESSIGNALFPNKIKIRTIHDNARIISAADTKQPILKENLHTGIIDLYKEGISRAWNAHLEDSNIKLKTVKFCDDILRGSTLFAPGIEGIIGDICVGDDVFIQAKNGHLAGYGRAILPGKRMKGMRRGAAVEIIEKIKRK
jgi:predicted RNA-binding protein